MLSPGQNRTGASFQTLRPATFWGVGSRGRERPALQDCEENTVEGPFFPAVGSFQGQKCVEFQSPRILGYKKKLILKEPD